MKELIFISGLLKIDNVIIFFFSTINNENKIGKAERDKRKVAGFSIRYFSLYSVSTFNATVLKEKTAIEIKAKIEIIIQNEK
jgi:hypothetical protein